MNLSEIYIEKCINKILDNIKRTNNGLIIASPSKKDPDYFYHWVRDSAITMKVIINEYIKTNDNKYLEIILKYINAEYELTKLIPFGGLGEPKFNINKSCFNDNWGRPQNDGPALRGTIMIKIAKILKNNYKFIVDNIVLEIIEKDYNYVINNLELPCFDLWEEVNGFHFYTRLVTSKFIKEYNLYKYNHFENKNFYRINDLIKHHFTDEKIISSFDMYGNICRYSDSSIFMGLNHIDYDSDILPHCYYYKVIKNIEELVSNFNNKYKSRIDMVGRYNNDSYYDGHIWFICTISMISFYKFLNKQSLKMELIIDEILTSDENFNLSEQYNPKTKMFLSAYNLTWNYCEIYFYLNM
jgi:glucoamylase